MIVAIFTFIVCALVNVRGKGFVRVIPFLIVLISGYILTAFMRLVDFTPIKEAAWFEISHFILPFNTSYFDSFRLYFGPEALAIIPVAIVTLSEHIGDHTVLSEICGHQFLKDPGLNKTLFGDGLAICVSALLGGPSETTYGENTGVVGMTRVASNGLKVLIEAKTDFKDVRNLIIASAILVLGLGGAILEFSNILTISGTALSAIAGILLNLLLPETAND